MAFGVAYAGDDAIDADRPGIADGSHTLQQGRFQIEFGTERDHTGGARSLSWPLLLRYGLSDSFELRAESPSGFNPLSVGFKENFLRRDHASLGVIGRWFAANRHGDLRFAGDFDAGDRWSVNPNVGVETPGGATAAVTVQYNVSERSNVFVDGGAERSSVVVDTGAAWIIGRDTQVDVSMGWGAHGPAAPNVFWSAGVSRRF